MKFTIALKAGIQALGIDLSDEAAEALRRHAALVADWNRKVNLTAITEPEEMAYKHYVDSLSLLASGSWPEGASVLDVGSGGGYPGMVLRLWRPDLKVVLLDAQGRKTRALEEIARSMGAEDVEVVHGRAEEVGKGPPHREAYDRVVARAVGAFSVVCEYTLPFVRIGGRAALMRGRGGRQEAAEGREACRALGGRVVEVAEFKLPAGHGERSVVWIEKVEATPARFPRRPGVPARRPL